MATILDGHAMARNAGARAPRSPSPPSASFVAGTIATILIALFGPRDGSAGPEVRPVEYFSLMLLGLVASVILASGSVFKAVLMILVGVFLGLVGPDANSPVPRLTFGVPRAGGGYQFVWRSQLASSGSLK